MNVVVSILTKIGMSLVTESVIKKVVAVLIRKLTSSTKNELDDEMMSPVLDILEK